MVGVRKARSCQHEEAEAWLLAAEGPGNRRRTELPVHKVQAHLEVGSPPVCSCLRLEHTDHEGQQPAQTQEVSFP